MTTYTYAADGRVTGGSHANAVHTTAPLSYAYDAVYARLTSMTDGIGTTSLAYRAVGTAGALAVASVDGPLADDTVTYSHDALGRVAGRQLAGSGWTLGYDALGRPTTLTHALGTFAWAYVGQTGRVASLTYPTGMTSTYSYLGHTADRRLQTIHHQTSGSATLSRFDYTYDGVGNLVTWRQERAGQAAFAYTFTHDRVDQLTAAVRQSTDPTPVLLGRQAWTYDAAGNRTAAQQDDAVQASTFDSLNRLTARQAGGPLVFEGTVNEPATVTVDGRPASVDPAHGFRGTGQTASGTTTVTITARDGAGNTATQAYEVDVAGGTSAYTHDANGNLTSDGVQTYQWNARNELIRVQAGGVDVATFTYDGFGRRVTKTAGGVTTTYVYDAEDIVEERRSTGDVVRYIHGPGIDQVLARTTNGTDPVYYLTDHLGSVVQEVDATEAVVLDRAYDPWGVPVQGAATSGYAFTGREWDAETGLSYYRARYYQPATGQFLSEDPVWRPATLYGYVAGRPTGLVDPDGRNPLVVAAVPAAVEALVQAGLWTAATILAAKLGVDLSQILSRPPRDAYDPNGPKAPGRPTAEDGFYGGHEWVRIPNGDGHGWLADDRRVWVPTGLAPGRAHGGPHWDVQDPRTGGHTNVRPKKLPKNSCS